MKRFLLASVVAVGAYGVSCLFDAGRLLLPTYPNLAVVFYPPFGQARETYSHGNVGPFLVGSDAAETIRTASFSRYELKKHPCPPATRDWFVQAPGQIFICYRRDNNVLLPVFWFVQISGNRVIDVTIVTETRFES